MEPGVISSLRYFAQFEYAPGLRELHIFHPERISEADLGYTLASMTRKKAIICTGEAKNEAKYTLPEYSTFLNKSASKARISRKKVKRIGRYLRVLQKSELFQLVGLSGSVAMDNATGEADIDLFIITAGSRLFTARAYAGAAAGVMGLRRGRTTQHAADTVCLNMFMDESDLTVPKHKQTGFVAHEILQMKPLFSRGATYGRFLKANSWVSRYYPNSLPVIKSGGPVSASFPSLLAQDSQLRVAGIPSGRSTPFADSAERLLRSIQLALINRHKTTEIVTDTQLWFFPNDYEKKITV